MCELCEETGGDLVWQNGLCRVVLVMDEDYPGFCRVILQRHVAEMSDLPEEERIALMKVVFSVEQAARTALHPDKINLASLGNMTPHLHWHVIPRFSTDRHFPNPVWGKPLREGSARLPSGWKARLESQLGELLGPQDMA